MIDYTSRLRKMGISKKDLEDYAAAEVLPVQAAAERLYKRESAFKKKERGLFDEEIQATRSKAGQGLLDLNPKVLEWIKKDGATYLGKNGYVIVFANWKQAQKAAEDFGGRAIQSPLSRRFLVVLDNPMVTLQGKTKCSVCASPLYKGWQAFRHGSFTVPGKRGGKVRHGDYTCEGCYVGGQETIRSLMRKKPKEEKKGFLKMGFRGYDAPHKWSREARAMNPAGLPDKMILPKGTGYKDTEGRFSRVQTDTVVKILEKVGTNVVFLLPSGLKAFTQLHVLREENPSAYAWQLKRARLQRDILKAIKQGNYAKAQKLQKTKDVVDRKALAAIERGESLPRQIPTVLRWFGKQNPADSPAVAYKRGMQDAKKGQSPSDFWTDYKAAYKQGYLAGKGRRNGETKCIWCGAKTSGDPACAKCQKRVPRNPSQLSPKLRKKLAAGEPISRKELEESIRFRRFYKIMAKKYAKPKNKNAGLPDNIDKSGFRKGEYVGYGDGKVWRIKKLSPHGWYAYEQNGTKVISGGSLEELSRRIKSGTSSNPIPSYLAPVHDDVAMARRGEICYGCAGAVKQAPSGRWYITMGHPGFNTSANNGNGYATKAKAVATVKHYARGRNPLGVSALLFGSEYLRGRSGKKKNADSGYWYGAGYRAGLHYFKEGMSIKEIAEGVYLDNLPHTKGNRKIILRGVTKGYAEAQRQSGAKKNPFLTVVPANPGKSLSVSSPVSCRDCGTPAQVKAGSKVWACPHCGKIQTFYPFRKGKNPRKSSKYSPAARKFISSFMRRETPKGRKLTKKQRGKLLAIAMSKARKKFLKVPAKNAQKLYKVVFFDKSKKQWGPAYEGVHPFEKANRMIAAVKSVGFKAKKIQVHGFSGPAKHGNPSRSAKRLVGRRELSSARVHRVYRYGSMGLTRKQAVSPGFIRRRLIEKKELKRRSNPGAFSKIYSRLISIITDKGTFKPRIPTSIWGDKRSKNRMILKGERWSPAMEGARVRTIEAAGNTTAGINPSQHYYHPFKSHPKLVKTSSGGVAILGAHPVWTSKDAV